MLFYCDQIVMEDGVKDGFLSVENGTVSAFYPKSAALKADIDYTGRRMIPGIIDTHNHGCFGFDILKASITPEEIDGYLRGQAARGVTAVFPTVGGSIDAINALAEYPESSPKCARIMGIHSEGPWGSRVGEKGVNTGYPSVDMAHAAKMVEAGKGKLKLVDIAPEVPGALEAIRYFKEQGITVGAYHTSATYAEANLGIDAGITVATHLGNVMTGLHHRDIGTLGACLNRPEVDCEVICDGLHISMEMIDIYFRLKDRSRFMMISDNVSYAGLPAGTYPGMNSDERSDRKNIHITEEGFVLSDTGRLSGSAMSVLYGIGNLVRKLGIPLEEVVRMSSLNPARKYGFADRKGSLAVGKDADFVVIDENYSVLETWREGEKLFDAASDTPPIHPAYASR